MKYFFKQVTEFCTYGSLFDFLHSMDWMVTDERLSGLSGLSGSAQSWAADRLSQHGVHPSLAPSSTSGGDSSHITSSSSQVGTATGSVELQGSVGNNPLNLNLLPPQTTDSQNWHNFTQLATPPASPAPSPAMAMNPNNKHIRGPGLVSQIFTKHRSTGANDPDLMEKGGNELSGLRQSGSGSVGKSDSSNDLASKLADALSSHHQEPAGKGPRSEAERSSWSNSFRTVH